MFFLLIGSRESPSIFLRIKILLPSQRFLLTRFILAYKTVSQTSIFLLFRIWLLLHTESLVLQRVSIGMMVFGYISSVFSIFFVAVNFGKLFKVHICVVLCFVFDIRTISHHNRWIKQWSWSGRSLIRWVTIYVVLCLQRLDGLSCCNAMQSNLSFLFAFFLLLV